MVCCLLYTSKCSIERCQGVGGAHLKAGERTVPADARNLRDGAADVNADDIVCLLVGFHMPDYSPNSRFSAIVVNLALEFCLSDRSREGKHVADVANPGQIHNQALKSQAVARMLGAAILAPVSYTHLDVYKRQG